MARHQIRIAPSWSLLLRIIRVRRERAFVDVDSDEIKIQFGYVSATIPYSNISEVEPRKWPILYGIGLRIGKDRTIGYIGSTDGVVGLSLVEPQRLQIGPRNLSMECRNIAVSLVDPEAFIEDVRANT